MLGFRNRDNGNGDVRPEVKDVQDDFLNIYRRVYDKEKSWAKRFTEEATPQTQKDFGVIESIENKKDFLLKNLQDKLTQINSVKLKKNEVGAFDDFSNSYDIIKPYNEIIRMYLNPENNSKTKEEIKAKIQEIGPLVNQIIYTANATFNSVFFESGEEMYKRIINGNHS
jgi:Zn-dependent M32 family carboxypeptidase